MMAVTELKQWIEALPEDGTVGIDDDGMALRLAEDTRVYCEVGGLPGEMDECRDDPDEPEPYRH